MTTVTEAPKVTMKGLDNETIAKLMAGRSRNQYGPKLIEFLNSDEAAINPAEVWPVEFAQKESTTLYQGFVNALKKAPIDTTDPDNPVNLSDVIQVKQSDGNVYLLHTERVKLALQPADDDDE